jgi:hypothetical protein
MIRIKPKTKRTVAGIVAILLAVAMLLSSVSVLFIEGAGAAEINCLNGGNIYEKI